MLSCAECSCELTGHYEFRADGEMLCIDCFEGYERKLRAALKTGSIEPVLPSQLHDPGEAIDTVPTSMDAPIEIDAMDPMDSLPPASRISNVLRVAVMLVVTSIVATGAILLAMS